MNKKNRYLCDLYDAAFLKLSVAEAVIDALADLNCTGNVERLRKGNLDTLLIHAGELIKEAGEGFLKACKEDNRLHPLNRNKAA